MPPAGVTQYEAAYDAAGIRDDSLPPDELREIAEGAALASSDMKRAVASIERLAPGRPYSASPLLREIRLEPPPWLPLYLPIGAWDMVSALQWTYRLRTGAEHQFMRRAREATDWLTRLVDGNETVVAVTHGGFRRILEVTLVARGWSSAREPRAWDNWSVWSFTPRE